MRGSQRDREQAQSPQACSQGRCRYLNGNRGLGGEAGAVASLGGEAPIDGDRLRGPTSIPTEEDHQVVTLDTLGKGRRTALRMTGGKEPTGAPPAPTASSHRGS